MKQEINPKDTSRAQAFELWMSSPMPMVTLTKTFDVTRLYKMSKRKGMKFNMLLCWYIGKAASLVEEFYTLPI
ncbi:MAG: chloramphenicol acetyltransferase, partial [Muribaculaceae bacterium]|nr:chloramphenicol acetyltransferase [Muribaculaceae bacterium]